MALVGALLRGVGRGPRARHLGLQAPTCRRRSSTSLGPAATLGSAVTYTLRSGLRRLLLRQQEGIDAAAGRDEIQIRRRAFLRRLDVRDVLRRRDDPEVLVAAHDVEDLLLVGQQDHRRVPQLRRQRDQPALGRGDLAHARASGRRAPTTTDRRTAANSRTSGVHA